MPKEGPQARKEAGVVEEEDEDEDEAIIRLEGAGLGVGADAVIEVLVVFPSP